MKKFKTFHCGVDPTDEHAIPKTAVEWANKWIEENPDVDILVWTHDLDKDGYDVICILYEELEKFEDVPILFCKDIIEGTNNAIFECPKCSSKYEYPVFIIGSDIRCKKCELNFGRKKNP